MKPEGNSSSRRRFLQFLAGSPLLALGYAGLPPVWRELVAATQGSTGGGAGGGGGPLGSTCPDCGGPTALISDLPRSGLFRSSVEMSAAQERELIASVDEAINVWDFAPVLRENNLPEHWNYLNGGVDDDATILANRDGFERLQTRVRRLVHDRPTSTTVEVFGREWGSPLFLCPVASLGAYHSEGETGAARAAASKGHLLMQSTVSSHSYEQIAEGFGEPHWFQLYSDLDWNRTKRMLDRVKAAGCPVVAWTIDLLGSSNRETLRRSQGLEDYDRPVCQQCHQHEPGYQKPMRRDLDGPAGERTPYNWDYVKRLKDYTDMKIVLKGIVTREDAALAVQYGADGIYVSNHGGRAEESLRGTIDSLPEVAEGNAGRLPIFFDSGVRRGTDMFKALALGADMVGIGRPYVWGLGAFGEEGVAKVIDLLTDEFRIAMRQAGTPSLQDITPEYVIDPGALVRRIDPSRR